MGAQGFLNFGKTMERLGMGGGIARAAKLNGNALESGAQLGLFGEAGANGSRFAELRQQVLKSRGEGTSNPRLNALAEDEMRYRQPGNPGSAGMSSAIKTAPVMPKATATTQPGLGMNIIPSARPSTSALIAENLASKTRAANPTTSTSSWMDNLKAVGTGFGEHFKDDGPLGFASQMMKNTILGAGAGAVGGIASGIGSVIDPSTTQSNGIIKPMMQGVWKGALLSAVHAGGSAMTRAKVGNEFGWINRTGQMTKSFSENIVTRGALAAVAMADGGNISFTKAQNPMK